MDIWREVAVEAKPRDLGSDRGYRMVRLTSEILRFAQDDGQVG